VGASTVVGLLVLGAGVVALLFLFRRMVKREPDPVIARLIVAGFLAKLVGSASRYYIMGDLYGGRGDFQRYTENGQQLAAMIRSGTLPEQAKETGTPFMDFLAGLLFTVAPPHVLVGFAVFSVLAFFGAYLFLQAFRIAVPDGAHRRYAWLIFLLPTMVFWPSSLGKEAWLVFTLGLASFGAARVLRRLPFGYLALAVGGVGVYLVRPHMAALFAVSFAAAFLLRFRDRTVRRGALGWVFGLVLVGLATGYAASNFGEQVPRDESVQGSTVDQVFAETDRRTSQGGSGFESRPVRSPADLAHALVTVPFRPLPFETHNAQALVASLEGVLLVLLFFLSAPRLRTLPRAILRRPYIALASAYSLGFVVAFSNVGNFGILTRQRAQLFPFLLILLAVPRRDEEGGLPGPKAAAGLRSQHDHGTPKWMQGPLVYEQAPSEPVDDESLPRGDAGAEPVELVADLPDSEAPGSVTEDPTLRADERHGDRN
jgi:hypothetical protein